MIDDGEDLTHRQKGEIDAGRIRRDGRRRLIASAMTRAIAVAGIATLALGIGGGLAEARTSKEDRAVVAVKEQIGANWNFLTTYPKKKAVKTAHADVSCAPMSATRFKCNWTARNKELDERASGAAIVTVTADRAAAQLKNYRCTNPLYRKCL